MLAIWRSKTSRLGTVFQHVLIEGEHLEFIKHAKSLLPSDARLLPIGNAAWASRLGTALQALGVPLGLLTLGSLRAGGATEDYMRHENLSRTQFRGRWRSLSSVSHYLQSACAVLAALELSGPCQDLIASLSPLADVLFPLPPSLLAGSRRY